jgi:predicted RNase H-like HicB family nuclease
MPSPDLINVAPIALSILSTWGAPHRIEWGKLPNLLMNLQTSSSTTPHITLHILLEQQSNGHVLVRIPALPNCTLERSTKEEALEAIQQLLAEDLATVEVLPVHVSPTPSSQPQSWKPFLGMFKDDPYFAEISEKLWAKRQSDSPFLDLIIDSTQVALIETLQMVATAGSSRGQGLPFYTEMLTFLQQQ